MSDLVVASSMSALNFATRTIYLAGEIDGPMCLRARAWLDELADAAEITIVLTTEGGDCSGALGLIDAMRRHKAKITIEVMGYCWSVGAAILQGADVRKISKNSTLMLHRGSEEVEGDNQTTRAWIKHNTKQEKVFMSQLAARTGKDARFWERMFANGDLILSAVEAKKLNLIDEII